MAYGWHRDQQQECRRLGTSNPGDVATLLLWRAITGDFQNSKRKLGGGAIGFTFDLYADAAATKSQLANLMCGSSGNGQPPQSSPALTVLSAP